MKISAVIVAQNEEINIEDAVKSVLWCDEVILIDSNSRDKTTEIAGKFTRKIYNVENSSVTERRIYSLDKAKNSWILFVDADERITEELKEEITNLNPADDIAGYFLNRRNYWFGKWIKHSANYPDYSIRLFNKHKCRIANRIVHEGVEAKGKTQRLKNDLIHYSYRNLEHMIKKINYFSTLEAQEHFADNKRISKIGVFAHSISAFLRVYVSNKGYKDKSEGFFVSVCYALTNLFAHLKLLKLQGKI
jgi:glycosyltransferase involved in cell wall biosynthesis